MPETFKLAGREFHPVDQALSAKQDDFILAHLRIAGAMEVLSDADGKKRPDKKRAELLLTQIMLSGETHNILAGCLTEVGTKWSRAEADRNAAAFSEITSQDEKNLMRAMIIRLVIRFLGLGETSRRTSEKSSSPSGMVPPTESGEPSTSETLLQ